MATPTGPLFVDSAVGAILVVDRTVVTREFK